jgi:hypothetical protein
MTYGGESMQVRPHYAGTPSASQRTALAIAGQASSQPTETETTDAEASRNTEYKHATMLRRK